MSTEIDMDAILLRMAALDDLPWEVSGDVHIFKAGTAAIVASFTDAVECDFAFHARADVPALYYEVKRLRRELEIANGISQMLPKIVRRLEQAAESLERQEPPRNRDYYAGREALIKKLTSALRGMVEQHCFSPICSGAPICAPAH